MALRNIVTGEDPILYKKSRVVTNFDDRLHTLLDDMAETMYHANGVGLAAVQVGVLRRVVIVDTNGELIELVNPEILESSDEQQCGPEGCLSFPGEEDVVRRAAQIIVRAQNRFGEPVTYIGDGFQARAFAHELDHLEGIVFHDQALSPEEREEWENEQQKPTQQEQAE